MRLDSLQKTKNVGAKLGAKKGSELHFQDLRKQDGREKGRVEEAVRVHKKAEKSVLAFQAHK